MGRAQGAKRARSGVRGPRGGTTTISESGMVRKNLRISHEENEELRRKAYSDRRSETSVIREGLRWVLGFGEEAR